MLDHVSIPVRSLPAVAPFYDAVMAVLGHPKVGESECWLGYGIRAAPGQPTACYLSIRSAPDSSIPADPTADPTGDPSCHWAFRAQSRAMVRAAYAAGLLQGGRDNGAPGLRPHYHAAYYAAFLFDPCGNRIEFVCHSVEE